MLDDFSIHSLIRPCCRYDTLGGAFGSVYATLAIVISPRIGSACPRPAPPHSRSFALFAPISVAGQITCSVLLDHVGFLKALRKPFTRAKAVAMAVIVAGLVLVVRWNGSMGGWIRCDDE